MREREQRLSLSRNKSLICVFQDVAGFFTPLEEFEFWLEEMEDKLNSSSSSSSSSSAAMKKPKTRAEACQLIAVSKVRPSVLVGSSFTF